MNTITANDLKIRGIKAFGDKPTIISYRGKTRFLVLPESEIEEYELFCLNRALKEVENDIAEGRFTTDMEAHLKEVDDEGHLDDGTGGRRYHTGRLR